MFIHTPEYDKIEQGSMAKEVITKKEELWEGLEVRTMKKDIAWVQVEGPRREKERRERFKKEKELEERKRMEIESQKREEEEIKRREAEAQEKTKMTEEEKRIWASQEQKKMTDLERQKRAEEIRKRIEEEKRRREEEMKKRSKEELLEEEKTALRKEHIRIQKELQEIALEKQPLESRRNRFLKEMEPIDQAINVILKREELIEKELAAIEEKEASAQSEKEKRITEKRRWEIEEKRRETEKERWPWDEQKRKIEKKITEVDLAYQEILAREEKLKEERRKILDREEQIQMEKEIVDLKKALQETIASKKSAEIKRDELALKWQDIANAYKIILEKEARVEEDKRLIEEEIKLVKDIGERRKLEKERWEIEEKRREVERERWLSEERKKQVEIELKRAELNYQRIIERENNLANRIKEIEQKLAPGPAARKEPEKRIPASRPQGPPASAIGPREKAAPPAPPTPETSAKESAQKDEKEIQQKIQEAQFRIEEAQRRLEASKKIQTKEGLEEKFKDRLARQPEGTSGPFPKEAPADLFTVPPAIELEPKEKKDWGKLEKEWQSLERERGEFLRWRVEEKEKKAGQVEKPLPPGPVTLIRPLPQKPSFWETVGIRVLVAVIILIVLAATGGFWYWYLIIRVPPEPKPPPLNGATSTEPFSTSTEITIPTSLIPVDKTLTSEVSSNEEIPSALSFEMKEELASGQFARIVLKNTSEKKVVSLGEFFQTFQVKTPAGLINKFENDFTLFAYSLKGENRLGLAAKVDEASGLSDTLTSWEKTMAKDMDVLLLALGKKGTPLATSFKKATYQDTTFRYLTIAKNDFGLCYGVFGDYFVLTTSYEQMKKTIDKIKAAELTEIKKNIGQLFIVGLRGKELTPEIKDFISTYRPGGILLWQENVESEAQLRKFISDLQQFSLAETGLPLLIAVDQEGGAVSRIDFVEKTGQAEIGNKTNAYQVGKVRGEELRSLGINLNFAPVLDSAFANDYLFNRSFQKNAAEAGELGKYLILGQKTSGILSVVKHFPGYGGVTFNPEERLAVIKKVPEISQFKETMETNPEFVMTANVIYKEIDPALPFTFSGKGIQFLKKYLGDNIIIVADDLDQNSLLENYSLKNIVVKPLEAGVDILIFSGWRLPSQGGIKMLISALDKEQISRAKIKEKISKIIQLKQEFLRTNPSFLSLYQKYDF